MTRRYVAVCIAALAATLAVPASASASVSITIQDDNTFDPRSAAQDLGAGSFDWEWGAGGVGTFEEHNVVQDDELFSSGEPVFSAPDGFSVTASAGTYPYYCEIHVGMIGDVSVRPLAGDATSGGGVRVSWADASTTTGSRYDVRYKSGKKWKPWKKKTSKLSGAFGRNGKPVKLRKKAKLQARSRAGSARSEWSPSLPLEG